MIDTRPYAPEDQGDFLILYRACLDHFGIPPASPEQEARVLSLLDAERHMSCLMAYDGPRPVGFATWVLTLPAGAGLALYMKELFVHQSARGQGVGRRLLARLVQIAHAEGCARVDWQTEGSNDMAQAFYASIAAPQIHKLSYRLAASEFQGFRDRLLGKQ